MGFKDEVMKEKDQLLKNKRPYETAAFIIFMVLFLQQMFYLFRNLVQFMDKNTTNFSTTNITNIGNLQGFFNRIIFLDSSSWFYVILAIGALALYFALMYFFVFEYCRKRGLPKWTWTTLVIYGPGVFLAPMYIWFIIYVHRGYIFRFLKKGYVEFKAFTGEETFQEEIEEEEVVQEEPKEEEVVEKYE